MAEVPDHLVPAEGLTSSTMFYAGFDAIPNESGAIHRFDIRDENGDYVATFKIKTRPTDKGTIDSMVAEAHQKLTDILRQWLWWTDHNRQHHEKPDAHP